MKKMKRRKDMKMKMMKATSRTASEEYEFELFFCFYFLVLFINDLGRPNFVYEFLSVGLCGPDTGAGQSGTIVPDMMARDSPYPSDTTPGTMFSTAYPTASHPVRWFAGFQQ